MASSSAAGAAAAAAAGWLVSPLLQCLSDRATSCAEDLTRYLPGGAGDAHADLARLSDCLLRLHASAYAVERTRRRPFDPSLAAWLRRLKDAADDADDLLDDINHDRLAESLAAPRPKLRRILGYSRSLCRRLFFSDDPLTRLPSVLESVSDLPTTTTADQELGGNEEDSTSSSPRSKARPRRERKGPARYTGADWTT